MEIGFRFGVWERLAVTAFLASIAGVVVSVAYPLAYPASAISIETWRVILWTSIVVLGGTILFFLCDLGVQIALRRGIKLGTVLASIGTALIIIGAIVGLVGAFRIDNEEVQKYKSTVPDIAAEFEGMYAKDFSDLLSSERPFTIQAKDSASGLDATVKIRFRLYYDFRANSDFISIYIPLFNAVRIDCFQTIHVLRDQFLQLRADLKNTIGVSASSPGVPLTSAKDLNFSGRVFIYTLNALDPIQLGALVSYYRDAGMFLEVRSNDYYWFHRPH